jgi:hypothetical protein
MRVITPTKWPRSATIATWSRWKIGSRSAIGASCSMVSSVVTIAVLTGSLKRDGSVCRCITRSDSSTMPITRSPCITGICDTSNSFMRR